MINIRAGKPEDRGLVFSTMLRGLFHGCDLYGQIEEKAFYENYSKIIESLLDRAELRVACLADDEDVVLGYAIVRGSVLDYCFVKRPWRKQGIAYRLCLEINTCTHLTRMGQSIKNRKNLKFNPFA